MTNISIQLCKLKATPAFVLLIGTIKKFRRPIDVTEDFIRNYNLLTGLVYLKVCYLSDAGSGLKLVVLVTKR